MSSDRSAVARTAGALALAGAGALAWGALVEVRWYVLRHVSVPVLAPGQAPLRVLHVSDLHLTPGQRRKVDWVRDLATWRPHLVVDTGDNWAHLDAMPALLEALEPLLDVSELAAYLGLPVSTVYDWRTRGLGPRAYRFGKHLPVGAGDARLT